MAQRPELEVAPRTIVGKANKRLRKDGLIPGNLFGHNQEAQAIQLDAVKFDYLRRKGAMRSVLTLRLPDASTQTALVRHVQRKPSSGAILHVDFFRVNLTERITMRLTLHFVGESPAVKIEGGVLLHLMETLEVECQAGDIVDALEVDISSLMEIDAVLHASDVKLPEGYTLTTNAEEPIAKVSATRAEITPATDEAAESATPATPATQA